MINAPLFRLSECKPCSAGSTFISGACAGATDTVCTDCAEVCKKLCLRTVQQVSFELSIYSKHFSSRNLEIVAKTIRYCGKNGTLRHLAGKPQNHERHWKNRDIWSQNPDVTKWPNPNRTIQMKFAYKMPAAHHSGFACMVGPTRARTHDKIYKLTHLFLLALLIAQCPAGTYLFTPCAGNDDNVCQGVCVCVCACV